MPVVTETHQLANVLRRCECSDRLRLIARKRLVAVRQAPQIGHDKSILACELFDAQPPTARSSYVDVPPYMKFDRTARPGTAIY